MPYKDKEKEKIYRKKYREEHRDELKEYTRKNRKHLNEYRKEWCKENKERALQCKREYYRRPKGRYMNAKHGAERRNKSFSLTFEDFCNITSQPCYYCNDQMGHLNKAGSHLDRIDNSKGYDIENVRSCCWICNNIRGEHLTPEETKVAVQAILILRKER